MSATTPIQNRPSRGRRWVVELDPEIEAEVRAVAGALKKSVSAFITDVLRDAVREQIPGVIDTLQAATK